MDKNRIPSLEKKILTRDIKREARFFRSVERDYWNIKLSVYRDNILLIFYSELYNESHVRYFDNESEAVNFINYVLTKNK